jgi:hypothetical protein
MFHDLPPGINWIEAIYNPRKVSRLRRRQRELESGKGFTTAQFAALVRKYRGRCVRCGKVKRLGADHIVPLSKGGAHDISNIQPMCWDCNKDKGRTAQDYRPRDVGEWIRRLRGRCVVGSMTPGRQCKNLAVLDAEPRFCHVHLRQLEEDSTPPRRPGRRTAKRKTK